MIFMKINNENKLRFSFRMLCRVAKALGFELDQVLEIVEQEWERA
jgi:hypothetical protein